MFMHPQASAPIASGMHTTIIKQNLKMISIAGVPKRQALPGFLITASISGM